MRIKSRKERALEYYALYGDVSTDVYTRLKDKLGNKFNEELLNDVIKRIQEGRLNAEYNSIQITFYEKPIQSYRPRVNYSTRGLHVPNAKQNSDAVEVFVKHLKEDISIIAVPMKVELTAYFPMPSNVKPVEMVVYELEHDYAIGKPDFDNILKAYVDMIQKHIILDDDLTSSCSFNKYYSLKPRVVLNIIYPNGYYSEYTYKTITSRKRYSGMKDFIDAKLMVTKPSKGGKHGK